jgi:hypothetical protein
MMLFFTATIARGTGLEEHYKDAQGCAAVCCVVA